MNFTNFYAQNFSGGNEPYTKTIIIEGGSGSSSDTSIEEKDPLFSESPAAQITDADIEAWDQKMDESDVEGFVSEDDLEATLSEYVNGAEYDSNSKKILLKNADSVIAEIDATDFIKDGMLENAEIKDGKLVLTFNAESGSEAIELSISDIFNADNYYTRDQVDQAIENIDIPNVPEWALAQEKPKYTAQEVGALPVDTVIPSLDGYATMEDVVNYCPTIEDTRNGNSSDITGVAPFETLEDGQRIILHLTYATEPNSTLNLTLSDGTTTGAKDIKYQVPNTVLPQPISEKYGKYMPNRYVEMTYDKPKKHWVCMTAVNAVNKFKTINNETILGEGNISFTELTAGTGINIDENNVISSTVVVPTNVSAFTNDAGYLISSDVANLATKSYVDDELAKKANASAVPTKLSQLTNDAGYITSYTETDPAFTNSAAWGALLAEIERLNNLNKILIERNADSAETISAMTSEDAANADIIVNSNSLNALSTPKTFNSINLVGGSVDSNNTVYLNANESVSVSDLTVDGTKGASGNGKVNFSSSEMNVSDVTIAEGSTVYNVFEGAQGNNNVGATDTFNATNVNADDTALKHNVFNIYKFNNNANVNVSDCDFNLDMANSNIMRISNVTNADNVTITFRNVNWTYENKGYTDADLDWAGLIIYQPYGTDAAFAGDLSHIATWTFNFINCKYNGVKVTENNFGSSNQVMYFYDINHEGGITDPTLVEGITINFE